MKSPELLRRLPAAGAAIGLLLLVAVAAIYWVNVTDRERYLRDRNFRLLESLTSQTQEVLESRARARVNSRDTGGVRIAPGDFDDYRVVATGDADMLVLHLVRRGNAVRPASKADDKARPADADLGLDRTLVADVARLFTSRLAQGAFDTFVLATADGRIVLAVGRRAAALRASGLRGLQVGTPPVPPARATVFDGAIAEGAWEVAGEPYRAFIHPCCGGVIRDTSGERAVGLVAVGLVETSALRAAKLAISPILILTGVAIGIAALVSSSFLKIAFVGVHQHVTRFDAARLWISSLAGIGLATILVLTAQAYAGLRADADRQLEALAADIRGKLQMEVATAYQRAAELSDALDAQGGCLDAPRSPRCAQAEAAANRGADNARSASAYYSLSLLDPQGYQAVKVTPTASTRAKISVAQRGYFKTALQAEPLFGTRRGVDACLSNCVVEPVWSWTTGKPQAVVSFATGHPALPVAAISVPMASLLGPTLPLGFEFAIVDQDGLVAFHSKPGHEHENLIAETDQDPRLQSRLLSRRGSPFSTSYLGQAYKAYVTPAPLAGWSIVTLHAKQHVRALVLEWTALALLMLAVYVLLWIAAPLVAWRSGGAWLWPDPLRWPLYWPLTGLCAAVALVPAGALFLIGTDAAWWALLIVLSAPLVLWGVAGAALFGRPPAVGQLSAWRELCRDYQCTAVALVFVTAVLPAAAFFTLSYGKHVEAYLKERHLAMARTLGPAACVDTPGVAATKAFHAVIYDMSVSCAPAAGEPEKPAASGFDAEDYAPYLTTAAVKLRALMHARADDESWSSANTQGTLTTIVRRGGTAAPVTVTSELPSVVDVVPGGATVARAVTIAVIAPALWGLSWLIVGFVMRRLLLADVVEPLRAGWRVDTRPGERWLVLCDKPVPRARRLTDACLLLLGPLYEGPHWAAAEDEARKEVETAGLRRRVVIPDLLTPLDGSSIVRRKMAFLERLLGEPRHTVVLLADAARDDLVARVRTAASAPEQADRWAALIEGLELSDLRKPLDAQDATSGASAFRRWLDDVQAILTTAWDRITPDAPTVKPVDWRMALLASEGGAHDDVAVVCEELGRSASLRSLTRDQMLEEIEERATACYQQMWAGCSPEERVVVVHVARHGLVSTASRRAVRHLMTTGLIRKDPELRLTNESFTRFVLDASRRREVAGVERAAPPSVWDSLRTPLTVVAVVAFAAFAVTQREALDATMAVAVGLTTAVSTLAKLTGSVAQLNPRQDGTNRG